MAGRAAEAFLAALLAAACAGKADIPGGIDRYTAPDGKEVVITPIKHASLQITYGGTEIQVDPVSSAYRPIVDYTDKPQADIILVTHDHYDHFDQNAIFLLSKPSTEVLLPQRCHTRYKRGRVMRNGDSVQIGPDISVKALPAYNAEPSMRHLHPKSAGNGYLLSLGGLRIYIAGDTDTVPPRSALGAVDIAFLPCHAPQTMGPAGLRRAITAIRPKIVYPYHFGQTPTDSLEWAARGTGAEMKLRYLR